MIDEGATVIIDQLKIQSNLIVEIPEALIDELEAHLILINNLMKNCGSLDRDKRAGGRGILFLEVQGL